VDLLVNIKDERENPLSQIVLERIMVLAVAQESNRGDENRPKVVNAVTLEVTPMEAEKIDLARNIGTLSLMLRNQVDTKDNVTAGARRSDLFARDGKALPPTPVAAAAPAPGKTAAPVRRAAPRPKPVPVALADQAGGRVEVIRGVQKSTSDF
jgi:pilus assembly protein CpaB